MPDHAQPGTSRFAFPMATTYDELWDDFGYGITTFDANFDGIEDICTVHSEFSLAKRTGVQADFNGDGIIQMLDQDDLALNGNEIVIFAVENINLDLDTATTDVGDSAQFLDYYVELASVGNSQAVFNGFKTGGANINSFRPSAIAETISLRPGEMILIEGTDVSNVIPQGGNNLGQTDGAWFIYLESIDNLNDRCVVTIGRALGCTFTAMDIGGGLDNTPGDPWYMKRFYVDGHEYNVVAIMTVKEDLRPAGGCANSKEECYEFKYITIRTQVPKVPVNIEQHSVWKQAYIPCSDGKDHFISVMPPFNYDHTCKEDIQAGWATTQAELKWLSDNDYKGDIIKDKPPVKIHIEEETREEQFKGELKEKYNKRPLCNFTVANWNGTGYPPVDFGEEITGYIDGRAVTGFTFVPFPYTDGPDEGLAQPCWHWLLVDDITRPDLTWYDSTQVMSTMYGKFVLIEDENGDGNWTPNNDEYWVMTVDYLTYYWDQNLGRFVLNEDYLCLYAVDVDNDGNFSWHPTLGLPEDEEWEDWQTWMTEQWHTIPDLYTDISIDQGDDEDKHQLYMLTSSWYSDQSQIRIPYYEDGALRTGQADQYEFYVPDILFTQPTPVTIEIFLYWIHDIQDLDLVLIDAALGPIAVSNFTHTSQEVISFEVNHSGKYFVVVEAAEIQEDLAPEPYELYIEVRGQGARVKFWYDPEDCKDIYVNTAPGNNDCPCYKGDCNNDCTINAIDLTYLAAAWPPLGTYNACVDFDNNGVINAIDLSSFAAHWGETYCDCAPCSAPPWQPWP
jgi:hypothetical protein